MPKQRKASKTREYNCSFCGHHKDDVPLMIASNTTQSCICSWCALGVIEQTFKHGLQMEKKIREHYMPKPEPSPQIEIASKMPDKVDIAVAKALKKGG